MEVRIMGCDLLKELTIKNRFFVAGAKDQQELVPLRTLRIGKQPLNESPDGSNPGAGADKDGVLQRFAQREHAVRPVKMDSLTLFYVAQQVGEKTVADPVEAQIKASVVIGGR